MTSRNEGPKKALQRLIPPFCLTYHASSFTALVSSPQHLDHLFLLAFPRKNFQ